MNVPHEPLDQTVEAFGRRLAADGRSSNTISAYLQGLKRFTGVLLTRHPGVTIGQVTQGMLDEALTASAVAHTAGLPDGNGKRRLLKELRRGFPDLGEHVLSDIPSNKNAVNPRSYRSLFRALRCYPASFPRFPFLDRLPGRFLLRPGQFSQHDGGPLDRQGGCSGQCSDRTLFQKPEK